MLRNCRAAEIVWKKMIPRPVNSPKRYKINKKARKGIFYFMLVMQLEHKRGAIMSGFSQLL